MRNSYAHTGNFARLRLFFVGFSYANIEFLVGFHTFFICKYLKNTENLICTYHTGAGLSVFRQKNLICTFKIYIAKGDMNKIHVAVNLMKLSKL